MTLPTIMSVVNYKKLNSSAKILWIKLFAQYGYESFSGAYEEMADEVASRRWTVRAQIWKLQDANAIDVTSYYEKGAVGQSGNTYRLINPKDWKNA
jgi:hypothetical protein